MAIGSLFSGLGGFELGLERGGLGPVAWQAEADPFCRSVLRRHWPAARLVNSVQEVRRGRVEAVEVICGGPPCQPVSVAGHGLGAGDPRWLWHECTRILSELQPEWAVWENVPMLRQRGLSAVLSDLAKGGWDAEWFDLRASDVGAPHRRERVWIVCHRVGRTLDRFRVALERALANGDGAGRVELSAPRLHADGPLGNDAPRRSAYPPLPDDEAGWNRWTGPQPLVRRSVDGPPDWIHRTRALGNAVVADDAEVIGRAIVEARS